MRKVFRPLLWVLVGAGIAGGVFFMLNRPRGMEITIVVSTPTPISTVSGADGVTTPEKQLININLAPPELMAYALPGIGEVKAQAIVDYRNREGVFHRTDELMKVPGIGPVTYQGLRELVTVGVIP